MRQGFLRAGLCAVAALCAILPSAVRAEDAVLVHLIGTGGPELTPTREGMSTLIEANEMCIRDSHL